VGLPADDKISISVFDTVLSGKQIIGSIVSTRNDLADVFALHVGGRTKVIAERRRLENLNECFDEVLAGHVPVRLVSTF
jgi:propanol-preferring alcohol dehydrogenase